MPTYPFTKAAWSVLLTLLPAGLAAQQLSLQEGNGNPMILENGSPVLTYQRLAMDLQGKWPRSSYIHPLFTPDGTLLTEDFPEDHRHHRGIFWAWHQIRWQGQLVADDWACKGLTRIPGKVQIEPREGSMRITATCEWEVHSSTPPSDAVRLVRETVVISVPEKKGFTRMLDVDLKLRALEPGVEVGGSQDDKGYGGFSPRIRLARDVRFSGFSGPVQPARTAVDAGPWVDVEGTLDGKYHGVAILVHPSHPGYPLQWILRASRSMQNPQWPGRNPQPIPTDEDLVLRYRLVLHDHPLTASELQGIWEEFAGRN